MRGRDQIAGGEGAFACACCDNVPSGEDSTPSRQWSDTHSRSECVSTCAGHTFGYESVSEEAWADAGTEAPDGIPYENAPSGEKATPQRGFPTGFRTRCALRRENDAGTVTLHVIAARTRPPAPKRRRRATSCVLVATSQTDTRRACRTSRRRRLRWCPRRSPAGQGSRRHRR